MWSSFHVLAYSGCSTVSILLLSEFCVYVTLQTRCVLKSWCCFRRSEFHENFDFLSICFFWLPFGGGSLKLCPPEYGFKNNHCPMTSNIDTGCLFISCLPFTPQITTADTINAAAPHWMLSLTWHCFWSISPRLPCIQGSLNELPHHNEHHRKGK